jgi:hypothetical protein
VEGILIDSDSGMAVRTLIEMVQLFWWGLMIFNSGLCNQS